MFRADNNISGCLLTYLCDPRFRATSMSSRVKQPRVVPLETPDNTSSDSSDSEGEEGKEIQVESYQESWDNSVSY